MAVKKVLVDDVDGSKAEKAVNLNMDGTRYHLDLSRKNFAAFATAVKPWIDAVQNGSASVDFDAVREWAREQGYEVSDRGRIKGEIMDAYEEAHA